MISPEALEVFAKYKGDEDGFVRLGTPREHEVMTLETWGRIEKLVQEAQLVDSKLAAPDDAERIRASIAGEWPDPASRSVFFRVAGVGSFV